MLWITPPISFSFTSFPTLLLCLNSYRTPTSISPSSSFTLDLLDDSFYESFLYLSYDLFGLIAWVISIFISMTHTDSDSLVPIISYRLLYIKSLILEDSSPVMNSPLSPVVPPLFPLTFLITLPCFSFHLFLLSTLLSFHPALLAFLISDSRMLCLTHPLSLTHSHRTHDL